METFSIHVVLIMFGYSSPLEIRLSQDRIAIAQDCISLQFIRRLSDYQ